MTTANSTTDVQCERVKIIPIFCHIRKKNFLMCHRFLVISLYVLYGEKSLIISDPSEWEAEGLVWFSLRFLCVYFEFVRN